MASVATRSYSAGPRCSILLTVLISNAECPTGKRPQFGGGATWGDACWGRLLGTQSAEMRPTYAIRDHKGRMASVRFPTISQENPHYPQPGTEPRRLMFEGISRRAPTPRTGAPYRRYWTRRFSADSLPLFGTMS
jgi:hypothetical protein